MEREPIKILPYGEVNFKWVSSYYDINLNGTCIYNGELCEFEAEYPEYNDENDEWEEIFVKIYRLGLLDKLRWYGRQKLFEQCVGYHWSYSQKKRRSGFYYRNPKWLYTWLFKFYYKKSKIK